MDKFLFLKKLNFPAANTWGLLLLVALIFSIFILPVLSMEWQLRISRIVYTILYFSAIFSLEKRLKSILILSAFAFCMEWLTGIFDLLVLTTVSKSLNILFFITIVVFLIRQVATSRHVNLKVILGSVIGYLLLGFIYSIFVAFIMQQDPAAFSVTLSSAGLSEPVSRISESTYFSFVTLATLGYGDILPMKPYTRSLAVWIAVSGQLYIAIIIALLVGKFASSYNPVKPE